MDLQRLLEGVGEALTERRVFGEAYQRDGVTVIPVASVRGGAGGGEGQRSEEGEGSGGGFGLVAKPEGVFVVTDTRVDWKPAVDVNRVILGAQIVAVLVMLAVRSIVRGRS